MIPKVFNIYLGFIRWFTNTFDLRLTAAAAVVAAAAAAAVASVPAAQLFFCAAAAAHFYFRLRLRIRGGTISLPPDILGRVWPNIWVFTVFCPYLSKKMRIFKNSSCMKHGGVYRIKHFYNIFWTNLPLKYDLYENLTKIAHLSQYFASISTKKRTCKKSRVIWNTRGYTGPDEVKTFFQQAILVKSDHWGDYDLTLRKNGSKTAHFWQYFAHISSKNQT